MTVTARGILILLGLLSQSKITESADCNQTYTLKKIFPDFDIISLPANISVPTTCFIELDTDAKYTVVASVTDLKLIGPTDLVLVYDGDDKGGSLAARYDILSTAGDILLSSTNKMTIVVNLDQTNGNRTLTLHAYPQLNGGAFYSKGIISLNGSVEVNETNTLYYMLVADPGQQVQLNLADSLMHPTELIEVYDGMRPSLDALLIRFKTDTPFIPVTGSKGKLLLVISNFNNLEFLNGSFSSVPAGCNQIVTGPTASFQLDRQFIKTTCSIVINPHLNGNFTPNSNIWMNLFSGISICQNETLKIYEGKSGYGNLLGTLTYSTQNGAMPTFSAKAENGMRLELDSRDANCSDQESGITFQGYYKTVPGCGQNLTPVNGTLTSPGYTNLYPLNAHCEWPLVPPENTTENVVLYVAVDDLSLAKGHHLSLLLNNGTVLRQYGGTQLPVLDLVAMVMNSTTMNYPVLVFDSTPTQAGSGVDSTMRGFKLRYSVIDCGGELTSNNGSFMAPKSKTPSTCIWIIHLPKQGANYSVNIVQFTVTASDLAKNETLELRDGGTSKSTLLQTNQKSTSDTYLTETNLLWVRYSGKFQFSVKYSLYNCNLTQQCRNGKCLHPDWKCDGIDQCGDMTDEKNCTGPTPGKKGSTTGMKPYIVAIIGILCFMFGVILTILLPALYKRIRYPNYRHLQDLMEPSVT